MPEAKTFAIDYDGTWSADPEAFRAFAALLQSRGHRVLVCTARATGLHEVGDACGRYVNRVLYSRSADKRTHCENLGERVDIWIDDKPESVGPPSPHPLDAADPFAGQDLVLVRKPAEPSAAWEYALRYWAQAPDEAWRDLPSHLRSYLRTELARRAMEPEAK